MTFELVHARDNRNARQRQVADWCAGAFGLGHAASIPQRGIRLVEEAIEAAQAAGCDRAMVLRLVNYVFDRPPGRLEEEIGAVGLTALALAQAAGVSAEACERAEIERVLAKPATYYAARNAAKNAAGFDATAADPAGPCTYCVGAGGWEAAPGATKYEWRECHECHGSGLAKDVA